MVRDKDQTGGNKKALPRPDAEWAPGGTPAGSMTAARVKGFLVNPLNAGMGPFPRFVDDGEWVAACARLIERDGAEQFLVNLLFVLRQSLANSG